MHSVNFIKISFQPGVPLAPNIAKPASKPKPAGAAIIIGQMKDPLIFKDSAFNALNIMFVLPDNFQPFDDTRFQGWTSEDEFGKWNILLLTIHDSSWLAYFV